MRPDIRWCVNALPPSDGRRLSIMAPQEVAKARAFHQSIPGYAPTPLQRLNRMAQRLGLGSLWICDTYFAYDELKAWLGGAGELFAAMAIGYAAETPRSRPRRALENIVEWRG